jgi:hypothetical protein
MIKRMSWREKWDTEDVTLISPGHRILDCQHGKGPQRPASRSGSGKEASSHELMWNEWQLPEKSVPLLSDVCLSTG